MQLSDIDIDRLSHKELAQWATELWKRLAARGRALPALVTPGAGQKPIGYLIPASDAPVIPDADAEFIAETMRRIDNPPDRFLTVDEFLAALGEGSSGAIPA
jgi:hypothetical protein